MANNLYLKASVTNPSPGNYIPGTLQLPWNSNSANVDISVDGEVTKTADANMWNGGADFKIEKTGNFELHFKLIGDNLTAGIEYFKANSQFNYTGIDMCFYRSGTNCFIFENGDNVYYYPSVINDSTQSSIVRQGNFILHKIDGTTVRTQTIINTGKMFFTCSLYSLGAQVIDINIDL